MDRLKIGKRIAANEGLQNLLPSLRERERLAVAAFERASFMLKSVREEMFRVARECHPELEDYEFVIDHTGCGSLIVCSERKAVE